jgi:hypothetical protein
MNIRGRGMVCEGEMVEYGELCLFSLILVRFFVLDAPAGRFFR